MHGSGKRFLRPYCAYFNLFYVVKPKTMPTRRTPVAMLRKHADGPLCPGAAQASPVTESELSDSGLRGYLEDEVVAPWSMLHRKR